MTSEVETMREIMLDASARGDRLWRNNTGMAWQGIVRKLPNGDIVLHKPRPVHFGLAEGSGDLIGLHRVRIEQRHVGSTLAVFTSVEVKSARGATREAQRAFLHAVQTLGGLAGIARSVEDARRITERLIP